MQSKQMLLFLIFFVNVNALTSKLPVDTLESVDTQELEKELCEVRKIYSSIEKERSEEIRGLKALAHHNDQEEDKDEKLFFPTEEMKKLYNYSSYFLPLEERFCYISYKQNALEWMIRSVKSPNSRGGSDVRKMYDGLHVGTSNDPYLVNFDDRNHLRAIRATVRKEMEELIIKAWSNTTANRINTAMPEYQ